MYVHSVTTGLTVWFLVFLSAEAVPMITSSLTSFTIWTYWWLDKQPGRDAEAICSCRGVNSVQLVDRGLVQWQRGTVECMGNTHSMRVVSVQQSRSPLIDFWCPHLFITQIHIIIYMICSQKLPKKTQNTIYGRKKEVISLSASRGKHPRSMWLLLNAFVMSFYNLYPILTGCCDFCIFGVYAVVSVCLYCCILWPCFAAVLARPLLYVGL